MTTPVLCERGFYCPRGSEKQRPCPTGTYGNMTGLSEEWECLPCDPGTYCKGTGTTLPHTHTHTHDGNDVVMLLKGVLKPSTIYWLLSY